MRLHAFRLPSALVARLDLFRDRLQAERPDTAVTRADALRKLLHEALSRRKL
jgi:hypothetical protein